MKHIHFIGIGGTGLSAIARILLQQGFVVSGSDSFASNYYAEITRDGAKTVLGHDPNNILGADVVVRSSAIKDENPEVKAAIAQGIPVMKRSEFLPILLQGLDVIAISGSHGKTTTTSMVLFILNELGADPSFISGANVKQVGTNARAGKSKLFVIEADEYDYMFLGLDPLISVITNIEHDHPDCFPTPEVYLNAFVQFISRLRPNGTALVCIDDPGNCDLLKHENVETINIKTYAIGKNADYQAVNLIRNSKGCLTFDVVFHHPQKGSITLGQCSLSIPGRHNVHNALAALAVVDTLGLSMSDALISMSQFEGAERRFDILGKVRGVTIINDYAHHPTQIASTLEAAHARFPGSKIWVIWEPHTYSRTSTLEKEFVKVLADADEVVITKIYAAREVDTGFLPLGIIDALTSKKACYIPDFSQVVDYLIKYIQNGDVVLVLSAGNAPEISEKLMETLKLQEPAS
jgi:UDP-N-acetylmuramate--alanine ligase